MKERRILAIETSCDETGVAVVTGTPGKPIVRGELLSSQTSIHTPYGGVVPELASREHLNNLPLLVEEIFRTSGIAKSSLTDIAITHGPGLKGCLLVGAAYGGAFASGLGLPVVPVHHMEAHLFSVDLLGETSHPFPWLSLIVSGGHTLLVLVDEFERYELLSRTRDDAAGEAFDKSATLLGLPYPGGPALSRLAEQGDSTRYRFPAVMPGQHEWFSFSGLKSSIARQVMTLSPEEREKECAHLAAGIETAIVSQLVGRVRHWMGVRKVNALHVTGGVAANRKLQNELRELCSSASLPLVIPPPKWCTDNGAMIGAVALRMRIGMNESVRARWPLIERSFAS